jgi:RNA polymerase sigma-70 factor (ECF subfamily)
VQEADVPARVRSGDAAAYAGLVLLHAPVAKRLALLTGAGPDADDVVQEAFVKAYQALPRFREGAQFRPWLLRIVVNETHNLRRGRDRRARREERFGRLDSRAVGRPDPADEAVASGRQRDLLEAVGALKADLRDVVACRYLLDLSELETAETLGIPAGTVKSRLHRALRSLREVLGDG